MSAARVIESMGATVALVGGKLRLSGLDQLDHETAARIIEVARSRKAELLEELGQPPNPEARPCSTAKLPCHGEEGTCFGKPYWHGQPFTGEKERHKATDLQACPYLEEVLAFQAKPDARPIVTPPMPPGRQGTRLEAIGEDDPLGLRQLRDLLTRHGVNLSRTPRGQLFAWMTPPLHLEALEFVGLMVREIRGDLQALKDRIPVMSAAAANVVLMRIEDEHMGFGVRPGWEGLTIPVEWPAQVKVALQSIYVCTSYVEEARHAV